MSSRLWLISILILVPILIAGCMGRAAKKAPVDTVPEDVDPESRIEMLEGMKEGYPDDPDLYFALGNLYYDEAMPTDARQNYEMALRLDPKMNSVRVNLAMLLAESAEVDSARALLEEAVRIDPEDAKAYNNLGMVYYTEMDIDKAVKYFSKALEVDPDNAEAHYNLGLAFAESGLLLEAVREWRKVIEMGDDDETAQRAKLSLDRVERELKQ